MQAGLSAHAPAKPDASAGAGSHKKVKEIEGRRREFDREVFAESPGHQARAELFARFRKLQDSGDADAASLRKKLMQEFRALPEKYPEMAELEAAAQDLRRNFFEPFIDVGLTPGICDVKAGDLCASNPHSSFGRHSSPDHFRNLAQMTLLSSLTVFLCGWACRVIFDTGLYHGCCNAEAPFGNELLRTIFIQSMVPIALLGEGRGGQEATGFAGLDHQTTVLAARKRAYEVRRAVHCAPAPAPAPARLWIRSDR